MRGLLCYRCNYGLGFFQDNKEALIQLARYVAQVYKPSLICPEPNEHEFYDEHSDSFYNDNDVYDDGGDY